jgi:uncharacterized repeat protein (TIGR01451 family)
MTIKAYTCACPRLNRWWLFAITVFLASVWLGGIAVLSQGIPAQGIALPPCRSPGEIVEVDIGTGLNTPPPGSDPHWQLVAAPPSATGTFPAYSTAPFPGWVAPPSGVHWIQRLPSATPQPDAGGNYTYRLQFTLNPALYSSIAIVGRYSADNTATVALNGLPVSACSGPSGNDCFKGWQALNVTSGFVSGVNVLDITVSNHANVTGLIVEAKLRATCSACATPPACLVAWYPLDEQPGATTIADVAPGFNNAGTPYDANGGATSVSAAPGGPPAGPVLVTAPPLSLPSGMVGSALYFYGPYIGVPNHPDLNFGAGPFSMDAWVYYMPLSPVPPGSGPFIAPIVDKYDPATNRGYALFLYIDTTGTHLRFRTWDGVNAAVAGFPIAIPPLTWFHVAVVVHRPGPGVAIYINGAPAVTGAPVAPGSLDNTVPLWVGKSRLHGLLNAGFREIALDELEIFNCAITAQEVQSIFAAGPAGKCREPRPTDAPTADLGDAPDSTNTLGLVMTTYAPPVTARFPTVFASSPPGPKHLQPKGLAWLGKDVSFEDEADLPPDADGVTNIDPSANSADRDKFDDGVVLPVLIPLCGQTQFTYTVTSTAMARLYVNVWFDFNRDGDWDDGVQKCPLGPAVTGSFTEWAVQNEVITVVPGLNTFTTPPFGAANPTRGSEMWMRITLTDTPIGPAQGADGTGPATGYTYGETEDYLLRLAYTEICGVKFHDLNGNGVQDPGEPGLPGWVIEVKGPHGNLVGYAVTDATGRYCIVVPAPGTYTVSEQQQPGWTPTTPPSVTVAVPPAVTNVNFGNRRAEPVGRCDLAITKVADPPTVGSGQQVTYTITVTNVGTAACPGPTTVTETVPAGLVLVSAGGFGWLCLGNVCTYLLPIPAGGSVSVAYTFNVTAPAGTVIENCATVANANDANLANNRACAAIRVARTGGPGTP